MLDSSTSAQEIQSVWDRCLESLATQVDTPIRSALSGSKVMQVDSKGVVIGTHGAFSCDFLNRKNFKEKISQALEQHLGKRFNIAFTALDDGGEGQGDLFAAEAEPRPAHKAHDSDMVESSLNPRYTFNTFIRGSSNNLAAAAAAAVAESPAKAYNPLFLFGGVGLGKTHLMHAIGHEVLRNRRKARVIYMSAERFTNEMIDSIGEARMNRFRRNYRNVDVLLVDDIQFLASKERTQEEFFHTFNELHGANKQIVISSDRPPKQIPTLEDRLRSRFEWGMIADIQPPDLETRIAILKKKAEQCKVVVPMEISSLIAERISSNIRELEGALTRVIAVSSLQRRPITMDMAQEALAGILPELGMQTVDIRKIQETVSEYFNLPMKDLLGHRRDQKIVRPRQVAMYLCKELTGSSFPEIGNEFGGKDHTTVMHSCRKVESNLEDHYYKTSLDNIRNRLRGVHR